MSKAEENRKLVERALEGIHRGDLHAAFSEVSDDFKNIVMFHPNLILTKSDLVNGMAERFGVALEGGRIPLKVHKILADDDCVVVLATGAARTKTGFDYCNDYCEVWNVVDGKIVSLVEYMDTQLASAFSKDVGAYLAAQPPEAD
jgi:ketosteroid isomerase-like protein